jgi:hypothetical protein
MTAQVRAIVPTSSRIASAGRDGAGRGPSGGFARCRGHAREPRCALQQLQPVRLRYRRSSRAAAQPGVGDLRSRAAVGCLAGVCLVNAIGTSSRSLSLAVAVRVHAGRDAAPRPRGSPRPGRGRSCSARGGVLLPGDLEVKRRLRVPGPAALDGHLLRGLVRSSPAPRPAGCPALGPVGPRRRPLE